MRAPPADSSAMAEVAAALDSTWGRGRGSVSDMTKVSCLDITYFISRYDIRHFVSKRQCQICIISDYANVLCTQSQLDAVGEA